MDLLSAGPGFQARSWNNGVITRLQEGSHTSQANCIAIAGNDVYIAGWSTIDPYAMQTVALYWKNGIADTLTDGVINAQANSITIAGTDVYVAGSQSNAQNILQLATYWKNGAIVILPSTTLLLASATSIAVSGNDIYVVGSELNDDINTAILWKDGMRIALTDGTNNAAATAVIVIGADVYIAGYEFSGIHSIAKYWKNGVPVSLTNGTKDAAANAIAVIGNDVYVAGYEGTLTSQAVVYNPDNGFIAKYWKNGVAVQLGNKIKKLVARHKNTYSDLKIHKMGILDFLSGDQKPAGNPIDKIEITPGVHLSKGIAEYILASLSPVAS